MSLTLATAEDRSPLKFILIAAGLMLGVVLTLYFTTWRKMADLTVTKTDVFAPHTTMKATPGAVHIVGTLAESQDNVYIVAHVHFTNHMSIPMQYSSATAVMIDSTGAELDADVIAPHDLPRLGQTFPALTPLVNAPLSSGDDLAPRSPRDATLLLLFSHITAEQWKARKSATLTLNFAHQDPLSAPIP